MRALGWSRVQMRGEGEAVGIRELAVQGKRDIGIGSGLQPNTRGNRISQATFVGSYLFCRVVDLRRPTCTSYGGYSVRWCMYSHHEYVRHEKKWYKTVLVFYTHL